jgi:hypothetical protein
MMFKAKTRAAEKAFLYTIVPCRRAGALNLGQVEQVLVLIIDLRVMSARNSFLAEQQRKNKDGFNIMVHSPLAATKIL